MMERQGRRREQLLVNLTEMIEYWKLKLVALHRPLWRNRFGRGYGLVIRETTEL